MISEIIKVFEADKEYVQAHTKYLFRARSWLLNGRKQADLMFGVERKAAVNWLKKK